MSLGIFNFNIDLIWMCRTAQLLVPELQEKYLETQSYTAIKVLKSLFLFLFLLHEFFISFVLLHTYMLESTSFNIYWENVVYYFLLFYKYFFWVFSDITSKCLH